MTLQEYLVTVLTTLDMIAIIGAVVSVLYLLILYTLYFPIMLDNDLYQKERYNKFLNKYIFYCVLLIFTATLLPSVEIGIR